MHNNSRPETCFSLEGSKYKIIEIEIRFILVQLCFEAIC